MNYGTRIQINKCNRTLTRGKYIDCFSQKLNYMQQNLKLWIVHFESKEIYVAQSLKLK